MRETCSDAAEMSKLESQSGKLAHMDLGHLHGGLKAKALHSHDGYDEVDNGSFAHSALHTEDGLDYASGNVKGGGGKGKGKDGKKGAAAGAKGKGKGKDAAKAGKGKKGRGGKGKDVQDQQDDDPAQKLKAGGKNASGAHANVNADNFYNTEESENALFEEVKERSSPTTRPAKKKSFNDVEEKEPAP